MNTTTNEIELRINNQKNKNMEVGKEFRREVLIDAEKIEKSSFLTFLGCTIWASEDA